MASGTRFLIRMSSTAPRLLDAPIDREHFGDGLVWHGSRDARQAGRPAPRLRLLRIRGRHDGRTGRLGGDVWRLTNVLDAERLTADRAGHLHRPRWEDEGRFGTTERTPKNGRLVGRPVRSVPPRMPKPPVWRTMTEREKALLARFKQAG